MLLVFPPSFKIQLDACSTSLLHSCPIIIKKTTCYTTWLLSISWSRQQARFVQLSPCCLALFNALTEFSRQVPRHDHLVSVLFGDLLSHSYNITVSMFLYLVTVVFYGIKINYYVFEEQLNQQGQRTIWGVRSF